MQPNVMKKKRWSEKLCDGITKIAKAVTAVCAAVVGVVAVACLFGAHIGACACGKVAAFLKAAGAKTATAKFACAA
jgi:hypothetical protein